VRVVDLGVGEILDTYKLLGFGELEDKVGSLDHKGVDKWLLVQLLHSQ
jgi:hypothetical protein